MIRFDEWWLPDGETHLQQYMEQVNHRVDGRLTYQYDKYQVARDACAQRRTAIDVGAHVGTWSYWMAQDFRDLIAFEPVARFRECWTENMRLAPFESLYDCALGRAEDCITLQTGSASCTGGTFVTPNSVSGPTVQRLLDGFGFTDVDLIKIDVEGYEIDVLEGAEATLGANHPIIIVECGENARRYGYLPTDACMWLSGRGFEQIAALDGDYVFRWRTRGSR